MQQAYQHYQRCLECVRDHLSVEPGLEMDDKEMDDEEISDSDEITNRFDSDEVSKTHHYHSPR